MGVIYTGAGGPTDIASLTISLFRVSNIPARYVRGLVSLNADQVNGADSQLSRWLGTRSVDASVKLLNAAQIPGVDSPSGNVQFNHVWIEACVPYAHYRGSRIDVAGSRWIALDPSFRSQDYVGGKAKANPAEFDYSNYLAKRTVLLPAEHFEDIVRADLVSSGPVQSIDDLLYVPVLNHVKLDVLPSSLPYTVLNYGTWQNSGASSTATLPPQHIVQLNVTVKDNSGQLLLPTTQLSMPEVGMQRISLLFKDASGSAVGSWLADAQPTTGAGNTAAPCSANVVLVFALMVWSERLAQVP